MWQIHPRRCYSGIMQICDVWDGLALLQIIIEVRLEPTAMMLLPAWGPDDDPDRDHSSHNSDFSSSCYFLLVSV